MNTLSANGAAMLFGLGSSQPLAARVAAELGVTLAAHEEREFEDGEHKARPLQDVRGCDVYVLHSLHADQAQSANDKLCRLLFFLATVRDHGASRVCALTPYLCYARKDRRSKPFDPLTLRYVGQLFDAVGVDAVLTLEVHNPAAFENAFRCRVETLPLHRLLSERVAADCGDAPMLVLSPDAGGHKRADAFRRALVRLLGRPVELGLMEKRRSSGEVSGEQLFAEVDGKHVVIVDDLISTGGTLLRAARAARAAGATSVLAVAAHGLFVGEAARLLADPVLDRILTSDSVPAFRLQAMPAAQQVEVLSCAPLFADAIRRLRGEQPALPEEA